MIESSNFKRGFKLNRYTIALLLSSLIIIATATGLLINYKIISVDSGIIYGVLISLGTILLETLIPTLLNYSIAPKVSLKIDNIKFEKKTFKSIEGYLLTSVVTNKGKRIALNLDVTIQIKNEQKEVPTLLYVTVSEQAGRIINVETNEESFGSNKYAWIDDRENKKSGTWEQLRQNDSVNLHFPYVSRVWIAFLDDPVNYFHYDLIKLRNNACYEVMIEVKGEDAEKNTVCGRVSKKVTITQ